MHEWLRKRCDALVGLEKIVLARKKKPEEKLTLAGP
jgi:hypothetical protein